MRHCPVLRIIPAGCRRFRGISLGLRDRLHVTYSGEVPYGACIEGEGLPCEGTEISLPASFSRPPPNSDLGARCACARFPEASASPVSCRRGERTRAGGSGIYQRGLGLGP